MSLISWWNFADESYITVCLNDREYCDIKRTKDNSMYVMSADNGFDVYEDDEENGIRILSPTEIEKVMIFADKCFRRNQSWIRKVS